MHEKEPFKFSKSLSGSGEMFKSQNHITDKLLGGNAIRRLDLAAYPRIIHRSMSIQRFQARAALKFLDEICMAALQAVVAA